MILRGQYTFRIRTLHAEYGPVIRINPYELHISDPDYYDELYVSSASGDKRNKWEWYTKQFGTFGSMFSTIGKSLSLLCLNRHRQHSTISVSVPRPYHGTLFVLG